MTTTFQQTLPGMNDHQENQEPNDSANTHSDPAFAKPKIKEIDRQQNLFRNVIIENLIPENHEARAIWEFVGQLDLTAFYQDIRTYEGSAGRSSFSPRLLISLWVYAYCRGVGFAREVARLIEFDPAFQWLTGMTPICYHTLSDFRIDHQEALNQLLIEVLGVLSAEGLVTLQQVAHDGTKVKAHARGSSFRREERIAEHLELARQQVKSLNESLTPEEFGSRAKQAAEARVQKLEKALQELEKIRMVKKGPKEKAEARVSETDPESRIMKQNDGGFAPSYNVQVSTDSQAGVIVGVSVTQAGNDTHELIPGMKKVEENMERKPQQALADGGYTNQANIQAMKEQGIDFIGSISDTNYSGGFKGHGIHPDFTISAFQFDGPTNTYTCPAGQRLHFLWKETSDDGKIVYRYAPKTNICSSCQLQNKCCPKKPKMGRTITRSEASPTIEEFKKKMATPEAKEAYKKRAPIAEFSNLWLKSKIGLRQFVLQGLQKVNMEALWACITINIQKWIALKWKPIRVTG